MKLWPLFFLLLLMGALLIISGCADRSEPLPVIAGPAVIRNWSPQEECALAKALAPYPDGSILWTLHDDWARMRREIGIKPNTTKFKCKGKIDGPTLQS